jgi:hypothetical protein
VPMCARPAIPPRMSTRRKHRPQSRREAFGTASQAEMYLSRALEEFHRSANAPDLWIPVDAFHRDSLLEGPQASLTARNRRLHFLRSTVLFAALSAEAFANELLDELLSSADADALDKLSAPDKLLIGTRTAAETSPLTRGAEPMQGLVELVRTRNRLVHPRPKGGLAAWVQDVQPTDEDSIGPAAARRAILSVADAVVLCTPVRKHPLLHGGVAKTIARHRALLDRHQDNAGPTILDVPDHDAAGVPGLYEQMQEVSAAKRDSNPVGDPREGREPLI